MLGNGNYCQHLHGFYGHGKFIDKAGSDIGHAHHHQETGRIQAADNNIADGKGKEGAKSPMDPASSRALNSKDFIFMNASKRTDKKCMFQTMHSIIATGKKEMKIRPAENILSFNTECSRI